MFMAHCSLKKKKKEKNRKGKRKTTQIYVNVRVGK